jgi:hypothetical protein
VCESCTASELAAWDGTFAIVYEYRGCCWAPLAFGDNRSIDGKLFSVGASSDCTGSSRLWLDTVNCRWVLGLYCNSNGGTLVWLGYKTTGLTPAGTYSKDSGCAGPDALVVEAY